MSQSLTQRGSLVTGEVGGGEAGGDRSRFKTSYRRRLKGWNILRASDGKQEARAGLARKPGYFTLGSRPAPHMKAALGVCIKEYTLRV